MALSHPFGPVPEGPQLLHDILLDIGQLYKNYTIIGMQDHSKTREFRGGGKTPKQFLSLSQAGVNLQKIKSVKVCLQRCVKSTPAYFSGTNTLVLSASFGRNTLDITMGFFGPCILNEKKYAAFFYTSQ